MKVLVIIIAAFSFTSMYTPDKDWPKKEKKAFMESCVDGIGDAFTKEKAEDYCSCMLEKIIDKYPKPEKAAGLTDEEVTKYAEECLTE